MPSTRVHLPRLLQSAAVLVWYALSFYLVVAVPVLLRRGEPIWGLAPENLVQLGFMGAAHAAVVAVLAARGSRGDRPYRVPLPTVGLAALGCAFFFGATLLVPRIWPAVPFSRSVLVLACALSFLLVLIPLLLPRRGIWVGLLVLIPAAVWGPALVPDLAPSSSDDPIGLSSWTADTQDYALEVTEYSDERLRAAAARASGGGLHPAGPFLLLGTGAGTFHLISRDSTGIAVRDLAIPSPANADEFDRDAPAAAMREQFRVQDVWAEQSGNQLRIVASHHYWDSARECYALRVSEARVPLDPDTAPPDSPWTTRFQTEPCLPFQEAGEIFVGTESGGRLLRTAEGFLLSVGDHAFDGIYSRRMLAQEPGHYGKTVLIPDPPDTARVYTTGHRNPQGLFRDSDGNIWLTEHGPRGGDELNRLVEGENYGWPLVTYGTEYDSRTWSLAPEDSSRHDFRPPDFAWVPSVAISDAVASDSPLFPAWKGDLMIASLAGQTLFRARLENESVAYVEPIELGRRLRDVTQSRSGRLVAWTDAGSILFLGPAAESAGEAALRICLWCHSMEEGSGASALAPDLSSIVGREIAARPLFSYSDSLAQLSGTWTVERLDRYIADPQGFVPGTSMAFPGIPDPDRRRALIEYLQRQN